LQAEWEPALPKLYSVQGYRYCDLILAKGQPQAAIERASNALKVAERNKWLLSVALDHLTLGRAHAVLCLPSASSERISQAQNHLDTAVDGLRRAGEEEYIARGLLARAVHYRAQGAYPAAASDLASSHDIACSGAMRLQQADAHLESARLALAQFAGNDATLCAEAEAHTLEAAKLITATGYNRRLGELAALRACLNGALPAHMLGPDRDENDRPIWHDLTSPPS